jgi:hypothetical protein
VASYVHSMAMIDKWTGPQRETPPARRGAGLGQVRRGWGAVGNDHGGEAEWSEQTVRRSRGGRMAQWTRPLWADGTVDAAAAGGQRGESGRDGRHCRNVLDDT